MITPEELANRFEQEAGFGKLPPFIRGKLESFFEYAVQEAVGEACKALQATPNGYLCECAGVGIKDAQEIVRDHFTKAGY